jgi:hypothetical protein
VGVLPFLTQERQEDECDGRKEGGEGERRKQEEIIRRRKKEQGREKR